MNIAIRPIEQSDIERIALLVNDRDIAKTTSRLPYPYTISDAKKWFDYISRTESEHSFAIADKKTFLGVIGLVHEPEHQRAELGYWLGKQYWNQGITSIAVEMMLGYAFQILKVNKVYAYVYGENTASQKVLNKNGFKLEGNLKQHTVRMGMIHDLMIFGLLREDYND